MTSVRCIARATTRRLSHRRRARTPGYGSGAAIAVVAVSALLLASAGSAQAAATPVLMRTAEPFAVLAGTGITSTGTTTINGDIGSLPNAVMTVSGTVLLTGTNHGGDGVTATAKTDLTAAYLAAEGQTTDFTVSADLAGQTLIPGVYTSATGLAINGPVPLTLDGRGDQNAVFVFQSGSTLITQPNTRVNLINGATACNVFWQVTSSTTLGVNSTFRGTILTLQSSTLNTGATLEGSVLSRNGAVTLQSNTILRPGCATPVTTPVTTPITPPITPPVTPPVTTPVTTPVTPSPTRGTTSGQVRQVPVGSVDAGGGGTAEVARRLWSSATR
jgi:type VI secretion system secreted protein VgrG